MTRWTTLPRPAFAIVLLVGLSACGDAPTPEGGMLENRTEGTPADVVETGVAPIFEVDPDWPRDMPELWIMGSVTGVFVDDRDHVWVTHLEETLTPEEISAVQDPPIGTCCRPAPAVVEFDAEGDVVQ